MEEVDFEIFRMTTFSTNGHVDGKEGRKGYVFFRPKRSQLDLSILFMLLKVAGLMSWQNAEDFECPAEESAWYYMADKEPLWAFEQVFT